jgi:hypothetical protein
MHEGRAVAVADVVVVILLVAVSLVVVCAREEVDGHRYPTEHPIPSYSSRHYPILTWLSLA